MRLRLRPGARLRAILGPDAAGVRQSLVALGLNSSSSLVAGAFLGSITGTFERYPGLLVLVPAAIGLRGNIFGTFGSRISTTIHAGTFRLSTRRDTVLGQNVLAAGILTLAMSLLLAVTTKAVAVALGLERTISVLDLAVISIVGGFLGSLVVMAATLGLTAGAVRYGWDLDNVNAPLVSTLGDVLTLPALFVGTFLVGFSIFTPALGVVLVLVCAAATMWSLRTKLELLPRIVKESLPILAVAGGISAMAGILLEKRFGSFSTYPALLVLVPAQLSTAGALGGILAGRLSTKIHLGLVIPLPVPGREARGRHDVRGAVGGAGVRLQRDRRPLRRAGPWPRQPRDPRDHGGVAGRRDAVDGDGRGAGVLRDDPRRPGGRRPRHLRHPGRQLVGRLRRRVHADPRHRGPGHL